VAKKPTTVGGVFGKAAMAFLKGKPQPPIETVIDAVRVARKSHDLSKAKGREKPKVEVTPKPKSTVKKAIDKGIEKAAAPKKVTELRFDATSFGQIKSATDIGYGAPAPAPVPAAPVSPEPAPRATAPSGWVEHPLHDPTVKHPHYEDAVAFLKTLGMKDKEARANLDKVAPMVSPYHPVNELVKLALKHSKI